MKPGRVTSIYIFIYVCMYVQYKHLILINGNNSLLRNVFCDGKNVQFSCFDFKTTFIYLTNVSFKTTACPYGYGTCRKVQQTVTVVLSLIFSIWLFVLIVYIVV